MYSVQGQHLEREVYNEQRKPVYSTMYSVQGQPLDSKVYNEQRKPLGSTMYSVQGQPLDSTYSIQGYRSASKD